MIFRPSLNRRRPRSIAGTEYIEVMVAGEHRPEADAEDCAAVAHVIQRAEALRQLHCIADRKHDNRNAQLSRAR